MFRRNLLEKGLIVTTLTLSLLSSGITNNINIVYAEETTTESTTEEDQILGRPVVGSGTFPTKEGSVTWKINTDGVLIFCGKGTLDTSNYWWKGDDFLEMTSIWEAAGVDKTKVIEVHVGTNCDIKINSCVNMFADFPNLKKVSLYGVDTSDCECFDRMFRNSPKLTYVNLAGVVSNVSTGEDCYQMFDNENVITRFVSPVGHIALPIACVSAANGGGYLWFKSDDVGSVYGGPYSYETFTESTDLRAASKYNVTYKVGEFSYTRELCEFSYTGELCNRVAYDSKLASKHFLADSTFVLEDGYELQWYTKYCETSLDDNPIPYLNREDVTIYGKKVLKQRCVRYYDTYDDTCGGNPEYVTVEDGEVTLKALKREGYVFAGWYTDRTYETKITTVSYNGHTDAYAKWEKITTEAPTTVAPTTEKVIEVPTTVAPTTVAPTTEKVTEAPTTEAPTTVAPTTEKVTEAPTTVAPTTEAPTTVAPTTVAPTTEKITEAPTTAAPTTEKVTVAQTTAVPTTEKVTVAPTTAAPTTEKVTVAPTTAAPTTEKMTETLTTTEQSTTQEITSTTEEISEIAEGDTTPPVIKGFKNKQLTNKAVTVSVIDDNLKSLKVNGKKTTSGTKFTKSGTYKVVVIDKAGNKTSSSFTIDKTGPKVKSTTKKLTVTDTNGVKWVKIDSKKYSYKKLKKSVNIKLKKKKAITVKACDRAGNITGVKFIFK